MARIRFEGEGREVEAEAGESILAAARREGVEVAHACGGRAKCTTCRVLVVEGLEACGARGEAERTLADARHFPADLRLACQTAPRGDVVVRPLVTDAEDARLVAEEGAAAGGATASLGEERTVAILFCDVRGFTSFAETHPPYDVVHALNRWMRRAQAVVDRHGGRVDVLLGDGLMAVFGGAGEEGAAASAARAGLDLVAEASALRPWFSSHFAHDFRIGVGLHVGDVILGSVGSGGARRLTALGDAVNLASRVETATKEAGVPFLATEEAMTAAGPAARAGRRLVVAVKGKAAPQALVEVLPA